MTAVRFVFAIVLGACAPAPHVVTLATMARPRDAPPVVVAANEPEEDFGCGVFAKDGVTPDARKARACLEKAAASDTCSGGSSPSLEVLELAVALIDGTGGPSDIPRARALLAPCFRDVSVEEVLAHADAVTRVSVAPPFESCDAFAQTTIAQSECLAEHTQNEHAWIHDTRKQLDAKARALFDAATKAHDDYATKMGAIAYAKYSGGTLRDPAMRAQILAMLRRRHAHITALSTLVPSANRADVAVAEQKAAHALAGARGRADAEMRVAIDDMMKSLAAYRDAEVAFAEHVHPGSREAILSQLARERADDLRATTTP